MLSLSSDSEYNDYANPLVCAAFVAMCPLWVLIARKTPSTREVLYSGWEPVIIAMAISRYVSLKWAQRVMENGQQAIKNKSKSFLHKWWCIHGWNCVSDDDKRVDEELFHEGCFSFFSVGGLILDKTVTNPNFAGIAVFTPVINGEQLRAGSATQK